MATGNLALMYFLLYCLLKSFKNISPANASFVPLAPKHLEMFENELQQMTHKQCCCKPASSHIANDCGNYGLQLFGIRTTVFVVIFYRIIFSFIPFLGSALVWIPASLFVLSQGYQHRAIYNIFLFGALVVSNIDNVFRFVLQKKLANVHPLITVFGVLFGLLVFGLPGFIFGPLMISYFVIGLKLYKVTYLKEKMQLFDNQ